MRTYSWGVTGDRNKVRVPKCIPEGEGPADIGAGGQAGTLTGAQAGGLQQVLDGVRRESLPRADTLEALCKEHPDNEVLESSGMLDLILSA